MRRLLAVTAPALIAGALITGSAVAQDVAAGEKAFAKCKACHTIEAGGPNRVGPNLHGIVGRKAGAVAGFKYSDAMMKSGITWTKEEISAYVKEPKTKIPGNKMAFVGIKADEERANLIAYIEKASK